MIAKAILLGIEYFPAPPFHEQSPQQMPAEIREIVRQFEASGGAEQMRLEPPFKDMVARPLW